MFRCDELDVIEDLVALLVGQGFEVSKESVAKMRGEWHAVAGARDSGQGLSLTINLNLRCLRPARSTGVAGTLSYPRHRADCPRTSMCT